MTVALSPHDRRRLAGVLARLSSNHAGERDAAALLASRIVRDRDVTWLDVLRADLPAHTPDAADPRRNAPPAQTSPCACATSASSTAGNSSSSGPWPW